MSVNLFHRVPPWQSVLIGIQSWPLDVAGPRITVDLLNWSLEIRTERAYLPHFYFGVVDFGGGWDFVSS